MQCRHCITLYPVQGGLPRGRPCPQNSPISVAPGGDRDRESERGVQQWRGLKPTSPEREPPLSSGSPPRSSSSSPSDPPWTTPPIPSPPPIPVICPVFPLFSAFFPPFLAQFDAFSAFSDPSCAENYDSSISALF